MRPKPTEGAGGQECIYQPVDEFLDRRAAGLAFPDSAWKNAEAVRAIPALGFGFAEVHALHLRFRSETHTITLNEIVLVVGMLAFMPQMREVARAGRDLIGRVVRRLVAEEGKSLVVLAGLGLTLHNDVKELGLRSAPYRC